MYIFTIQVFTVTSILILSHEQASVERGFSVNKAIEFENLSDSSYIFQRTVFDYIKFSGGVLNIEINKEMRSAAASARSGVRYLEVQYLEEQKSLTKSENSKRKRNIIEEEIDYMKQKKNFPQRDIKDINEEVDALADKAETIRNIDLFIKANELRRIVKEKEDFRFKKSTNVLYLLLYSLLF